MDDLTRWARDSIAKGSRSFALASQLFDPATRERAWLLYAWCRHCDDVIDEQELGEGHVASGTPIGERLAELRAQTLAALAGKPEGRAFEALARVAAVTAMPERYPLDLLEGFAMDARAAAYRTLDDTLLYSYHVAGVVGVMMALCMVVAPDDRATLDRACDLGIAFQLNNIARDVTEDTARGRSYLPADWVAAHGAAGATARLVDEAERYEASARHGTLALPLRSAWAVLAAARIYGDIGRRVRAAGGAPEGAGNDLDPGQAVGGRSYRRCCPDPPQPLRRGYAARRIVDDAGLSVAASFIASCAFNSRTGGAIRKPNDTVPSFEPTAWWRRWACTIRRI